MSAREKRAALNAIKKCERALGVAQFGWAVRKHMALSAMKAKAARRIREMRSAIAQLEKRLG